jgi:DNA-binding NtrC family response regulator
MTRALVLDDNLADRILFEEALYEIQFSGDLFSASNSDELIRQINKLCPSIKETDTTFIFVDLLLSGDSGINVLRKINKMTIPGKVLTFCLSGMKDEEVIAQAYRNGAYAFLPKPGNFNKLIGLLQDVFSFLKNKATTQNGTALQKRVMLQY